MIQTLEKFRGRSAHEMLTRVRQALAKTAEQLGIGVSAGKVPLDLSCSAGVIDRYASWLTERDGFVSLLEGRWPDHRRLVTERADRIIAGRFDLLGYEELDFGSPVPDWHFDPVSEKRSPCVHWSQIDEVSAEKTGDKKIIWELNRHQYFVTLGQAYYLTGDERYAETFANHLADWFAQNPPKTGVNWLSSLELAFRAISWIRSWFFFDRSPAFTPELKQQMLGFLFLKAKHIETYLSTYFSPNTHLTGEALGLYYIGSFLDAADASAKWKDTGYRILMEWIGIHIRPDGSYCEQSSHYARYTADFYSDLWLLRDRQGLQIEPYHRDRLARLFDYLLHLTGPDGKTPLFGDDDGGRFYPFDARPVEDMRATMSLGALLFGRGDLKYAAGEPGPELMWITGPEGIRAYDAVETAEPECLAKAFAEGGFFAARSSWGTDADHILINCGPHGFMNGGHAHADALGFTLYAGGRPIFIDAGTYVYTTDLAARDLFRSSAAHNCLTVDGRSSSLPAGPFSWKTQANARLIEWKENGEFVSFSGSHDGFESSGVKYSRSIEFGAERSLKIVDTLKSDGEHSFELNFVLSPGIKASIEDSSVSLIAEHGDRLVTVHSEPTGELREMAGKWEIYEISVSPVYGKQVPSRRLVYKVKGMGSIEIVTTVSRAK